MDFTRLPNPFSLKTKTLRKPQISCGLFPTDVRGQVKTFSSILITSAILPAERGLLLKKATTLPATFGTLAATFTPVLQKHSAKALNQTLLL
jgi:hypothetical protein